MNIKSFAEKVIKAEEEAFQKGNFEPLKALEDPNVVYHMLMGLPDMVGHEAHKQDIIGTRQSSADIKQEWQYLTGDGDLLALSYKSSARLIAEKPGLPIPVGKSISTNYLWVLRTKKGKLVEARANGSFAVS
jgi:ketosteroid isomerase-like protein